MIDKLKLAAAIQAKRDENPPHPVIIDCFDKTDAEINRIKSEARKSHPLQDMIYIQLVPSDG